MALRAREDRRLAGVLIYEVAEARPRTRRSTRYEVRVLTFSGLLRDAETPAPTPAAAAAAADKLSSHAEMDATAAPTHEQRLFGLLERLSSEEL